MKSKKIKSRICEFCTLLGFEYKGKYGYVDPFNKNKFTLFFDGETLHVDSIEKVMETPFFDGKSLNEISDEIEITEGM